MVEKNRNIFCGVPVVVFRTQIIKGLSHEIRRLKKFRQKFTELDLTKGRGCFLNFLGAPMILKRKK
jgi:hypothetical protein